MKLALERFGFGLGSTLGALSLDGGPAGFTIEDERRKVKVPGETCIPTGTYALKLRTEGGLHEKYKARFTFHRGMLWLQDVPDFKWVYLHVGNSDVDTDGCPLLVDVPLVTALGEFRGGASLPAYEKVYRRVLAALTAGEAVSLSISERGPS